MKIREHFHLYFSFIFAILFGIAPNGKASNIQNLSHDRPVTVSSTDYAPTLPEFAVDGEADTGWRAAREDAVPWIMVDLQASCLIRSVRLISQATKDTPVFTMTVNRWPTRGSEIESSCGTVYTLQISQDRTTWTDIYHTDNGQGGMENIALNSPVTARYVRLTILKKSNENPLGLNEFQVYGDCSKKRPIVTGWTERRKPKAQHKPTLNVTSDGCLSLDSGWEMTMDEWAKTGKGSVISSSGVDTRSWCDAVVPGTVLATLVKDGVFLDPVYGLNNLKIPESLCRHSWWYRRAFTLPAHFEGGAGRHITLEFDGINHHADVWVNGRQIGVVAFPFARGIFDITDALKAGRENVVAVCIHPSAFPGTPGDKGANGMSWVNSAALWQDAPNYVCASGWDWMPAVRDRAMGIWNSVQLRSTGAVVIGDPRVVTTLPELPKTTRADIDIEAPVRNMTAQNRLVRVTASFEGVKVAQNIAIPAMSAVTAVFSPNRFPALKLRNPKLWWPNGYGVPNLYKLSLETRIGEALSDQRSLKFGIRQVSYHYGATTDIVSHPTDTDFPKTEARYVRIFCRERANTSYGFSLWDFSVYDSSHPGTDLALHKTVIASSTDETDHGPQLAVDGDSATRWSSAYSDNQWICVDLGSVQSIDKARLTWETAYANHFTVQTSLDGVSWTDTKDVVISPPEQLQISVNGVRIFCRGGNWGYDELLRRMPRSRMETAVRMQRDENFTMVRNWLGTITEESFYDACDENGILVWNDFPPTGSDHAAYFPVVRDLIARYRTHPSIVVWCGTNESWPPKDISDGITQALKDLDPERLYQGSSADGIVEGRGPYSWQDPSTYFVGGGFHTEIGIPAVPVAETMREVSGDLPAWPPNVAWQYHDYDAGLWAGQKVDTYRAAIEARLGAATSLDDYCRKAQFVNYESMRAIFEGRNHNMWHTSSAILLWMSHQTWPSTVWQTYDYDFDINGAYEGARKGCEPLHVQATLPNWSVELVNSTSQPLNNASVTATVYNLDGVQAGPSQIVKASAPASACTPLFEIRWPSQVTPLHFVKLVLRNSHGMVISDNFYWRYNKPEDMQLLNKIAPAQLNASPLVVKSAGARTTMNVTLHNAGHSVAAMVVLSLREAKSGKRVLPAYYDKNYLWLLPGETQNIQVECATDDLHGQPPALRVTGYNLSARTVK